MASRFARRFGASTALFTLVATFGGSSGQAAGLTIIPTFDASITTDPQAAIIEATISAAIAAYQTNFSDQITVSINFVETSSGLGQSSSYLQSFTYAAYRAALASHAATPDDTTALAHLPNTAANPVNGNANINLNLPLARALGFSGANPPAGQSDGTIALNTSMMNLSSSSTNFSKCSLYAVACHEINEVLGFSSALDGIANGNPATTGPISPEDLFRYGTNSARSFTSDVNAAAYFSLDGINLLARFNQHQGGDFHDWYSFYGGVTPEVQDAYLSAGVFPVLGVELRALDAIGYTRVLPPPPPSLSIARAGGRVVISWPTNFPGFTLLTKTSLTSAGSWATSSPAPVILNGFYTVTNSATNASRFYKLIK